MTIRSITSRLIGHRMGELRDRHSWAREDAHVVAQFEIVGRAGEEQRERLARFILRAGGDRLHYGTRPIALMSLTERALADLAERVRADFWLSRRIDRENRAARAQRARAA